MSGGGAICGGNYIYRRRILRCWGLCDGARRRCIVSEGSPWYSPIITCCHCGDHWSDGELGERPFLRGWRQKAIAEAKARWAVSHAGPVLRDSEFYPIPDAS